MRYNEYNEYVEGLQEICLQIGTEIKLYKESICKI